MEIRSITRKDTPSESIPVWLGEGEHTLHNHEDGVITSLYIGVGVGPWKAERLVRKAVRAAVALKLTSITLDLPNFLDYDPWFEGLGASADIGGLALAMAREAMLAGYDFDELKEKKNALREVLIAFPSYDCSRDIRIGAVIGECANKARTLANLPANIATPEYLENHAGGIYGRYASVELRVLQSDELLEHDLELIHAVGKGSQEEATQPRLIELKYHGNRDSDDWYVVVGKGVCFDTGGLSMKSPENMLKMHLDMSGGAAALSILEALAELKTAINVVVIVPAVENSVSGKAYRPGDVFDSSIGPVEITNTDAEGRLVLADGLTWAGQYKPVQAFTIATLTGACAIALGDAYSGVFSTDSELAQILIEAGERAFDPVWRLPVSQRYGHYLKGDRTKWVNACMSGKNGGASSAALFLQLHADQAGFGERFAHFDMASRMERKLEDEHLAPGPMGVIVPLLVEHFLSLSGT